MRRVAASVALIVISTLLAGAPSPAQAATGLTVTARTVAVETVNGKGVVYVFARCAGSKTCSGRATLEGSGGGTVTYSVKAGKSAYLTVPSGTYAPDGVVGGEGTTVPATLVVTPTGKSAARRALTLEKRIPSRRIIGQVTGPAAGVQSLEVTRWTVSGLRTERSQVVDVEDDGTFDLGKFALGRNNAPGSAYRLSISAVVDGAAREWFWRGGSSGSGAFTGGGRTLRDAGVVRVQKTSDFVANFRWGTVSGQLTGQGAAGAEVRVIAPSAVSTSRASERRALDVPYCGNEFGADKVSADGLYSVSFVPRPDGTDVRRYMVDFEPTGSRRGAVVVAGGRIVDSCQAALGYANRTSGLLAFEGGSSVLEVPSVSIDSQQRDLDVRLTSSFALNGNDRWVSLREYTPGRKVLDLPVVTAKRAGTDKRVSFAGLRDGKYVLEAGRRTSCSGWFQSIYPDNYLYHKGLERQSERWKTVKGKYGSRPYNVISREHGYVPKTPGKGYKGWMYRPVCPTTTAGKATIVTVDGDEVREVALSRGATITGRISRIGGKSNKEILVTAYATDGTRVLRSTFSDRSGRFVLRGLASGKYKIVVNADSWRGIGRTHKGAQSKTVTAGRTYSVGTLNFRS